MVDFGQNLVGWVRLRVRGGAAGDEITVRHAEVLEGGEMGHAYVKGRSHRHAELAAIVDALMQQPERRAHVESVVVAPLERSQHARRSLAGRKAQATRVEFYTVARGDAA